MKTYLILFLFFNLLSIAQDTISVEELDIPDLDALEDIDSNDLSSSIDTSMEEKELLSLADKLAYKIPDDEWETIKGSANVRTSYTVKEGDWLFKISQNLFGTGHYYPKIWALNPYITNPHKIEPGMLLVFNSSASVGPQLTFGDQDQSNSPGVGKVRRPLLSWEQEKAKLINQGVVVDYASDEMSKLYKDAFKEDRTDYKIYNPPSYDDITPKLPTELENGGVQADKLTKKVFKQGFSINTFVSNTRVDSLGKITNAIKGSGMILNQDTVYIKLNRGDAEPGDSFSIYETKPYLIQSSESSRTGYQTIVHGHIKLIRKLESKWEAEVFGSINSLRRGMKLMKYTPKLKKIKKRYSDAQIESYVIGGYDFNRSHFTIGDIVFLDRGSKDGVKLGHVFGLFERKDNYTKKNIQRSPTYLTGEVTVISLTEEFASALVTKSFHPILKNSFAITIPEGFSKGRLNFSRDGELDAANGLEDDEVAKALNTGDEDDDSELDEIDDLEGELESIEGVDEFDEDNLSEEELGELEDMIDETSDEEEVDDEDLSDLEDIVEEEEVGLDEDIDINELEEIDGEAVVDDLSDLEAIEKSKGKKYLDEEINQKDNPYGLTENDLEEVDELMNLELE